MSESTDQKNPFAQFMPQNLFTLWGDQGTKRMEALVEEWEKWESRGAEQAEKAVEESASLMKSTFDYSLSLHAEFRKQAVENTKKALEMMGGVKQ